MFERAIVEYVVNSAWQIPLLAAGAWLLVKVMRPGVLVQHWLWLSVLAMAVVLPVRGVEGRPIARQSVAGSVMATPIAATPRKNRVGEPLTAWRGLPASNYVRPLNDEGVPLPFIGRNFVLSSTATRWMVALYMLGSFLGLIRLVRGLMAARRLVQRSSPAIFAPHTTNLLEEACRRLKVAMPRMRESDEVDGPVVVRALRPVMVLPHGFEAHEEDEVRAAMLHELAHVRRRDYLVNLVCQFAALPVVWHPALYGIQQKIRRTREMVCDAIAAEELESGAEYARCLMSLARQMVNGTGLGSETQAMGLFGGNTMEERVMNLTDATVVMSRRARVLRGLCGCAVMFVVAGAAATFRVRPTFAATPVVRAERANLQVMAPSAATAQTSEKTPASMLVTTPVEAVQAKPSGQMPTTGGASVSTPLSENEPKAVAGKGEYIHRWVAADGRKYVTVNRNPKEPSEEERLREEQKLDDAQKELDEMKLDRSMRNSQLKELDKDLAGMSVSRQQMRDAQSQITESKKEIDEALSWMKGPEFQAQMAELQRNLSSVEMKAQIYAANKMASDPAMKLQMDKLEKQLSQLDSLPELKKLDEQMALVDSAMRGNDEREAKMQKELKSGELKAKLEEATRLLEEVNKKMEQMQAK